MDDAFRNHYSKALLLHEPKEFSKRCILTFAARGGLVIDEKICEDRNIWPLLAQTELMMK